MKFHSLLFQKVLKIPPTLFRCHGFVRKKFQFIGTYRNQQQYEMKHFMADICQFFGNYTMLCAVKDERENSSHSLRSWNSIANA